MTDPIDVGMTIHQPLMLVLSKYVKTEGELAGIGKMIDILVASAQIHAVERGLGGHTAQEYRDAIRGKLESLGMMPAGSPD